MIELSEVSKKYGSFIALDKVNLIVPKGQVLGLLGPNGAGKSTLFNILSGYITASSGKIRIASTDIITDPLKCKGFIGFLPEHPPLYQEMTVEEYLKFCCELKNVVKEDQHDHIQEIINLTGIQTVKNRLIANLSKGFQQRIGLAQALCGTPEVLLLDEPSSGYDPTQLLEFRKLIQSLSKNHTIILSSHLIHEVQSICDRIIILHQGKLVYDHMQYDKSLQNQFFIRIKGKQEVILPALRSLSSIIKIKPLIKDSITEANIYSRPELNFEEELFFLLSALGTPIMELRPVKDNLEDIFVNITSSAQSIRLKP